MKKIKVRIGAYAPAFRRPTSPPPQVKKTVKAKIADCDFCNGSKKQSTPYVDIFFDRLGVMTGLKVFSHYCPPYGSCGSGWKSNTSFFPLNYCPYCGRKL